MIPLMQFLFVLDWNKTFSYWKLKQICHTVSRLEIIIQIQCINFELFVSLQKLLNISSATTNIHILTPQTKYFQIKYTKKVSIPLIYCYYSMASLFNLFVNQAEKLK